MRDQRTLASEFSTQELIAALKDRGYCAVPDRVKENLSWNRAGSDINDEAFKWEAVHKIAAQLEPRHLVIEKRPALFKESLPSIHAKLYLF